MRFKRWDTCSLCEQEYHGVVRCALGWACWKTYLGRPETDQLGAMAMIVLGNGLDAAKHHEDALSVREAELAMMRRVGNPESTFLQAEQSCGHVSQASDGMKIAQPHVSRRILRIFEARWRGT